MPKFPVVDNDGCFDHESVELTRPLLGFYVKNRPLGQVEAYADGLWDTCTLIRKVITPVETDNLTLNEFRKQVEEVLNERLALMELMHSYVSQARFEKREEVKP